MLVAVGGLMATLALPGRTVPALAVTATVTVITALRRRLARPKSGSSVSSDDNGQPADSVTLQWSDVTCTLDSKKDDAPRKLLASQSGVARPGRVLAILGPSGSGKTTLLNALAGRVPESSSISLTGSIILNDVPQRDSRIPIAYVTQEDLFFAQLTVRETIQTAARLRLPDGVSDKDRGKLVDDLIRKLSLVSAADTRVGNEKTRGISGGEKKRLSIACELLSTPRLIICDEPTSGLDAFQAESVMSTLRALAEVGHTVVCSIHQPSGSIFNLIDDIVLLASGQQVYFGSNKSALDFFAENGYPLPSQSNPAERYLQIISVDYSSDETTVESETRIAKLVDSFAAKGSSPVSPPTVANGSMGASEPVADGSVEPPSTVACVPSGRPNVFSAIRVLFVRAWRQVIRDKKTNMSRLTSSLFSAILFGAIYWRIGFTQTTIQDRLGLLQVCTINSAMSSLIKTLNVFPRESVLVNRERVRGSYSVFEYFASKLLAEMPVSAFFPLVFSATLHPMVQLAGGVGRVSRFLGLITLESFTAASYGLLIGALVPSTEAALAVGPASFVLQIVFGGLYITEKNVPKWASWVPRISLIKHAYEGLCVNELRGLEFETERPWDVRDGQKVLQRLSWGESTVAKTCVSQGRVLAFNYLATYLILSLKKPQFVKIKAAKPENGEETAKEESEGVSNKVVMDNSLSENVTAERV